MFIVYIRRPSLETIFGFLIIINIMPYFRHEFPELIHFYLRSEKLQIEISPYILLT